MTTTPEKLQVWFYSFCSDCSLFSETVTACLQEAQIITNKLQADDLQGPGIILVTEITSEVCEFVRLVSRNGLERCLILVMEAATLTNGQGWEILQAGASDVLLWNDLAEPGRVIAARLKRWQTIDAYVNSPLVRNNLVGQSRVWQSALRRLVEVALFTDAPVLLTGETGTGKELAARLIHNLDEQRKENKLIILDCTTIVPDLSGSELFGHERGAFTGAVASREGAFALADGGTLFLDEVGELPLELQVQLLRVLQEQTYKRVGSNTWKRTNFRLICATNRDLLVEEAQGRFRRDLYYRISAWHIKLPPLRERIEDIIPLARHFIKKVRPEEEPPELDARVQNYFLSREYLGNVRDLKNLAHRIATRHVGPGPITIGDIPTNERPVGSYGGEYWCDHTIEATIRRAVSAGVGLREIRRVIEDTAIRLVVDEENGNLQQAAEKLGVTDRTLQKRRAEQSQRIQVAINGNN